MKSKTLLLFLILSALILISPASWAQKTFITIVGDGAILTAGEASEPTYGRSNFDLSDYADVISYNLQLNKSESGTPSVTPVTIVKTIGPSSVLLRQAWAQNQVITATIRFFLPDPTDPTQSIQAYEINLSGGRINTLKPWQNVNPSSTALLESVSITFSSIVWTHPPTGTGFEYSPSGSL